MPPRPESADILLIGAGVASARCARMLRRRGFAGSILLVGDESALPYNRPPLSKELLRGEEWLRRVMNVLQPRQVGAIGNHAARALGPEVPAVRHPSHGGAVATTRGLRDLLARWLA